MVDGVRKYDDIQVGQSCGIRKTNKCTGLPTKDENSDPTAHYCLFPYIKDSLQP